ncbi:HNH endonuclease [Barrientosiimonas humi]|uniref:HNH endonuclease n=1 Tax=Barrientosiimonas humi TaxID=999931 RepID=A0A542XC41_9MICO|nr:HNH endonuclease signature motif containing protein [Barrientosiimonas humi]TQL33354.1 HNH endonuclease [Barrientosiimonas humi]CAG7573343.1 hypothetical protein BH39T_PBIAJDOK_01975 [Barrientosiimonas humi]
MTPSTAPTPGDPVAAARALFESLLYEDGLVGAVEGTFGPVARSGPHGAAEPQTHDPVVLLMGAIQVLTADLIDRMQRTDPFALSEQEQWLVPADLGPASVGAGDAVASGGAGGMNGPSGAGGAGSEGGAGGEGLPRTPLPVPETRSPAARGEVERELQSEAAWREADRAAERQAQFELTAVLAHAAMNQAAAVRAHATAGLARFDRVPDSAFFSAQECLAGEQPRPFDVVEHQPGHRAEFAGDLLGPALRLGPYAADSLVDDSVWLTTRVPGVLAAVGRGEVNIETAAAIAREVQEARPETCELVEEAVLRRRVHQRQRTQAQRSTRTLVGRHESEAARRSAKRTKAQQTGVWLDSHTTPGLSAFSAVMPTGKAVALMDAVDQRAHQAQQAARTGSATAHGEQPPESAAGAAGATNDGNRTSEDVARAAMLLGEHRAEALYDLAMGNVDLTAHLELIVPQPPSPEPPQPPGPSPSAQPPGPSPSPSPEPPGPSPSPSPEPPGPSSSQEPPPESSGPPSPSTQAAPSQGPPSVTDSPKPPGSRTLVTPGQVRQLLADVPVLLHERAGPVPTADVFELLTGRAARTTAEWVQLPIDPPHDVASMAWAAPAPTTGGVTRAHVAQAAEQPGPDQETGGYRPGARLRRRVIRRDQRCRFPGCDRRGRYTDLDHVDPWPRGPTEERNLQCLCRHHHRAKHEGGWRVTMTVAGRCTWTSPTGRVYVTDPGLPEALLDLACP